LLVAVILSAQCTDKRVNMTTPALFERYPTITDLSNAAYEELFNIVKSISYPGNKTRHLIGMAKMLIEKFKGEIPLTVEELVELPGVGRKTANVITSIVDNQPNLAVDTNAKNPLETEKQLVKHIPTEFVNKSHHWLILHGRYICQARKPKCEECALTQACKYYNKYVKDQILQIV
jgi:endonuclease-3